MSTPPAFPYAPEWDELLAIGDAIRLRLLGLRFSMNHPALGSDQVFTCTADPEDVQQIPSIAIIAASGTYGSESDPTLSPGPDEESRFPAHGAGHVLVDDGEFVAEIDLVVWASDPIMRSMLARAVREKLQQEVAGVYGKAIYGIDLPCPRYFGGYSKCHVSPVKTRLEDTGDDAKKRRRKQILTLRCVLSMYHVEGAQDLLPRLVLESVGDDPLTTGT
jgi:hypothetical protein